MFSDSGWAYNLGFFCIMIYDEKNEIQLNENVTGINFYGSIKLPITVFHVFKFSYDMSYFLKNQL
jgi:hypothetical protein